jgi:inositol transport system permease protein
MTDAVHGLGGLKYDPKRRARPPELNVFLALVLIVVTFEALGWLIYGDSFLFNTRDNVDTIFNWARLNIIILQVSIIGIIAIGVTQVIITGGIDLSSGSIVGATAMIVMSFAQTAMVNGNPNPKAIFGDWAMDLPVLVPVVVGLACGLAAGMINGLLIAYTRIPPFIATLGMMVSARGLAKWWSNGNPISFPTESYATIGKGMMPVLIFMVIAILFHFILKYTVYGKHTYAIGSNEDAARMSGINVARHKVMVYAIAGAPRLGRGHRAQFQEPHRAGGHGRDVRTRRHRHGGDRGRVARRRAGVDPRHGARRADLRRHHLGLHVPEARRLLPGDGEGRDHRGRRGARPVAAAPVGGPRVRRAGR